MTDDQPLRGLDIRSFDTGDIPFTGNALHIVLFETGSGRKGAIRINSFVAAGADSYILADIKMQKGN